MGRKFDGVEMSEGACGMYQMWSHDKGEGMGKMFGVKNLE